MPTSNIIRALRLPYGSTFDATGESQTANNVSLFLIAEGYNSASQFTDDCQELLDKLALIAPFGDPVAQDIINVFACYEPRPEDYVFPIGPDGPSGTLSTPLGAYFQPGNTLGQLHVSYERLLEVGRRIEYWSESQAEYFPLLSENDDQTIIQRLPGVIVVLFPKVHVGDGVTASYSGLTADEIVQVEMEHTANEHAPVYFAATTCNKGFERVAARALGLKLGLGDESEQERGMPSEWEGKALDIKPNLLYVPEVNKAGSVASTNKWNALTSEPIILHPKPDSSTNAALDHQSSAFKQQPIGMWEGGGGYSNGIYRPAHDCLMRRKPGVGPLYLKKSKHSFCPVCHAYLHKAIKGEYSTKRIADAVSLSTQVSEYNKVSWEQTHVFSSLAPAAAYYTVGPNDEAYNFPDFRAPKKQAFWGYTCHISDHLPPNNPSNSDASANSFVFKNIGVHQSEYYEGSPGNKIKLVSDPRDVRDVFSSIGFRNLKVTFENGENDTPADYVFVIADYIRDNKYRLEKSWRGHVSKDNLYQTGWKLRLVEDRPNWPRLEVELSLVMRGAAPDFDPGGVPVALKCYPQIQFKWFRRRGVKMGVKRFDGTVRTVVNVKHYSFEPELCADPEKGSRFVAGHHGPQSGFTQNNFNDASCFTDANISAKYHLSGSVMERADISAELLPPPFTKPTWAAIFDYYTPHVAQTGPDFAKRFIGVHQDDPNLRQGKVRKMYVKHHVATNDEGNDVFNDIFITKFPRQGGYDNIHVNGYMGKHNALHTPPRCDAQEILQEDVVAAPFCGMDCFHMHWRWSLLSDTIANLTNTLNLSSWLLAPSFRGWNEKHSRTRIGSPLIPPNQQLSIHLEAADHTKPREDKIVECIVSITAPAPGENQVILEQGMGWAMIYSDEFSVDGAINATLNAPPLPSGLYNNFNYNEFGLPISLYKDTEAAFDKVYDFIRFHHEYDIPALPPAPINTVANNMKIYNHAQVPDGRDVPAQVWPSALSDWHLALYKRFGDIYNLSLYPYNQQVIVEENQLSGIPIEDL